MTQEPLKIGASYHIMFLAYGLGYIAPKYGQKYGTNVPPLWDLGISIDMTSLGVSWCLSHVWQE